MFTKTQFFRIFFKKNQTSQNQAFWGQNRKTFLGETQFQKMTKTSVQNAQKTQFTFTKTQFKMPKKHKTSQKVAECKVENLLLSNITSTEVYV